MKKKTMTITEYIKKQDELKKEGYSGINLARKLNSIRKRFKIIMGILLLFLIPTPLFGLENPSLEELKNNPGVIYLGIFYRTGWSSGGLNAIDETDRRTIAGIGDHQVIDDQPYYVFSLPSGFILIGKYKNNRIFMSGMIIGYDLTFVEREEKVLQ